MSEVSQLVVTIKRQLKARGLTYRDVAQALELSEPSVKRLFSSARFTVERLSRLSQLLGLTLAELTAESAAATPLLRTLTQEQEAQLVADRRLLLVAVCVLNHWSAAEIAATYRFDRKACARYLAVLHRIGLIALLPGDRVRLRVARDFEWLPNGPIRRFFMGRPLGEFLRSRFDGADETLEFTHGMLTATAVAQLQLEFRRLRARFAALHDESAGAPLGQRRGTGFMLALREWEPSEFAQFRQAKR